MFQRQSARIGGSTFAASLVSRSASLIAGSGTPSVHRLSASRDSLMPSRTAALIAKYSPAKNSAAPIACPTMSQKVIRVISIWNACGSNTGRFLLVTGI